MLKVMQKYTPCGCDFYKGSMILRLYQDNSFWNWQRRYNDTSMMFHVVRRTVGPNLRAKRGISRHIVQQVCMISNMYVFTLYQRYKEVILYSHQKYVKVHKMLRYCIKSKNVWWIANAIHPWLHREINQMIHLTPLLNTGASVDVYRYILSEPWYEPTRCPISVPMNSFSRSWDLANGRQ